MSRPASRIETGPEVVVELETTVGSGQFHVDPHLRAEEIILESDERISRARLVVHLGPELSPQQARRRYHTDQRVLVRTGDAPPDQTPMLFEGYLRDLSWSWGGDGDSAARLTIDGQHVAERLANDPRAQILGRALRSLYLERQWQADPQVFARQSGHLTALPCRFNAGGRGNRSANSLSATTTTGQILAIPLFVEDGSPEGALWTFGHILRYLVWFHLPGDGSVGPGNVYEITQYLDTPKAADAFGKALLECPRDLVCEATNMLEALLLVTAEAGLRFHVETVNAGGRARSQLKIWDPTRGTLRRLSLGGRPWDASASPDAQQAGESFDAFLARNNTHRGGSRSERASIVNFPVVVGGTKKYEIAADLVPGWPPEEGLDNVDPADRDTMKAQSLTEEMIQAGAPDTFSSQWYKRYHRLGGDYDTCGAVSRKWVLNEAGHYDGQTYNRTAPFDAYEPFDFASAVGPDRTDARRWTRRRRRLLPLPPNPATGAPGRLVVEVSFDAGATWSEPQCEVSPLPEECGIFLDCLNPTDLAPPQQDRHQQNMWYALVDGTFRVRVRALVESDERILVRGRRCGAADLPAIPRSTVIYRPDDFDYVHADIETIDDTPAAQKYADRLARRGGGDRRRCLGAIPWLDFDLQIGDRLAEPLSFAEGVAPAVILAKRYLLAAGRAETEVYAGPYFPSTEAE